MANKGIGYAIMALGGLGQGYVTQKEKNRQADVQAQELALKKSSQAIADKKAQADVDKIATEFSNDGYQKDPSTGAMVPNPQYFDSSSDLYKTNAQRAAFKSMQSPKSGGAAPLTADAISRLRAAYAKGEPIPDDLKDIAVPSGYANMFASGKPAAPSLTAGQLQQFSSGKLDPNVVVPPAYAQYGMPKQTTPRPAEVVAKDEAQTGLIRAQTDAIINKGPPLTEAQKAYDREQGKKTAEYYANGGRAAVDQGIDKLSKAKESLASGEARTGLLPGIADKMGLGSILTPKTAAAKDNARNSLFAALRPILGAQFTEPEGERVLNQVWDPFQSPEVNMQKIQAQIDLMASQAADKDAAAKVYESTGSFKDYIPSRGGSTQKAATNPSEARAQSAKKLGISNKKLDAIDQIPVKKQYSPSRNQTRIVYQDGRVEVVDGKK